MKKRLTAIIMVLSLTAGLCDCANENGNKSTPIDEGHTSGSESASIASEVPSFESEADEREPAIEIAALSNTYTTRFGNVNAITYPAFSFDYPEGWTITQEDVTQQSELVTLESNSGSRIRFSYIGGQNPGGGSAAVMRKVEVAKAIDAAFIPGYVQAMNYSDLGAFIVAELKPISTLNMQTDSEYTAIEGRISYAVLPESFIGTHSGLRSDYILDFSFWYSGNVALITDGDFTEQEKQEIIAILASFRVSDASPKTTGGHTAASIDELWTMLEGTWVFNDFIYGGKSTIYSAHNLEFRYVDKKPCMSRDYQRDDGYSPDEFFYDIASINEFTYDVYTYKRGSYGGEGANWSSDVRLVWWSFDLNNLANGEISMTYNIATDNGSIDDSNTFKYIIL